MITNPFRRPKKAVALIGAAFIGATTLAVAVTVLTDQGGRHAPKPASTIASNTRICLIAKSGDPDAARIWAGIQQAATSATKVNAQQTAIPAYAVGSSNDVLAYAASLRQQHCAVTVAVGDLLHDAVQAGTADRHGGEYIYVSRAPVRAGSVVDLQPEQATAQRIAAEARALISTTRKT